MSATTTQTHLIGCPACEERVIAHLTYDVKLMVDRAVTAKLTLTGVRIHHECPKPQLVPHLKES